jgi:hypothetical protein
VSNVVGGIRRPPPTPSRKYPSGHGVPGCRRGWPQEEYRGVDEDGRRTDTRIETVNLSAGGFYATANRQIPELTRLGLRLVLPPFGEEDTSEQTIDCEAVVVRCDTEGCPEESYHLAACFVGIDPAHQRAIARYVAWHSIVYASEDEGRTRGGAADAAG